MTTFRAHYIERKAESKYGKREYWRTITADSNNEAINLAERMTRKGFICKGVTSYESNTH